VYILIEVISKEPNKNCDQSLNEFTLQKSLLESEINLNNPKGASFKEIT
jgi:hypothetical protein